MKKYGLVLFVLLIVFGLAIAGCGGNKTAVKEGQSAEPYRIGAIYSTTGPLATLGTDEYNGAKLYVDMINKKGGINGRPIELIFTDAQSKPEVAANAARKMIQEDKVLAIVGPESTAIMTALVPVVNEFKIPNISGQGAIKGTTLNSATYPWSFSTVPVGYLSTLATFQYLQSIGKTKVALMVTADAVGDGALKDAPLAAQKYGIEIVGSERYGASDKDMTVQLTKIRNLNPKPDAIFLNASGAGAAIVTINFKQLGMDKEMLFTTMASQVVKAYVDQTGDEGNGVIASTDKGSVWKDMPDLDNYKKNVKDFATQYEALYGKAMEWTGAGGANMIMHIAEAIKAVGPDSQKIRDHIENNQNGIQGIGNQYFKSKDDHIGLSLNDYAIVILDAAQKKWVVQDVKLKE